AAYLYWSGYKGSEQADLDVMLNGTPISAQRTFTNIDPVASDTHFGAFADVINIVKTTGNGTYLFSGFDAIDTDCFYVLNTMNYSGWAIVVVYEDPTLSGRMVNIYDGLDQIKIGHDKIISINLA